MVRVKYRLDLLSTPSFFEAHLALLSKWLRNWTSLDMTTPSIPILAIAQVRECFQNEDIRVTIVF